MIDPLMQECCEKHKHHNMSIPEYINTVYNEYLKQKHQREFHNYIHGSREYTNYPFIIPYYENGCLNGIISDISYTKNGKYEYIEFNYKKV